MAHQSHWNGENKLKKRLKPTTSCFWVPLYVIRTPKPLPSWSSQDTMTAIVTIASRKYFYSTTTILSFKLNCQRVAGEREYYGFDSNLHASLSGVPNIVVPSMYSSTTSDLPTYTKCGSRAGKISVEDHGKYWVSPNIRLDNKRKRYVKTLTSWGKALLTTLGTDLALIEMLLEFLPLYGINTSVLTGKTAFEVWSNIYMKLNAIAVGDFSLNILWYMDILDWLRLWQNIRLRHKSRRVLPLSPHLKQMNLTV